MNVCKKMTINGQLVEGTSKAVEVLNPATGKTLDSFAAVSGQQAQAALQAAQAAFPAWSALSIAEREKHILRFAEVLEAHRKEIVELLILETGKPIGNATYDYEMLPDCLHYYIEEEKRQYGQVVPDYDGGHLSILTHKPVGVVLGFLAWNFPILNLGYKLGPVLASGCTCVLKPSTLTPLATLYIGALTIEAGLPAGVVNVIAGSDEKMYEELNSSPIPSMITLIGSSRTGKKIIRDSANTVKRFSLELGGNAPAVVMKDADVKDAALKIADGKINNAGQVCVAPNRVFVHEAVMQAFTETVLSYMSRVKFGSGMDEGDVILAPMSSASAQAHMSELVEDALSKGAKLLCGGKPTTGEGFFFEGTVLTDVTPEMRVYKEEIFGPIISILSFGDDDDIAAMANNTEYGLAAYVYTKDLKTAMQLSREIDAGSVCVNEPFYNYNLPHGGCKESGVGKDCSPMALEECCYVQRIAIQL